jgi:nucleoside diphosphate kinase
LLEDIVPFKKSHDMVFYYVRANKSKGGYIVATKKIMRLVEEIFHHYRHVKDGNFMREMIELILNKLM